MKIISFGNREAEVPETWDEGLEMIARAVKDRERGGNLRNASVAARVAYGLFGQGTDDPTDALLLLMGRICEREGAGLDE